MPQFAGHIQALMTVPSGGAAVSASNGAHASAVTVTVPADDYWLNSTYNQASLLSTFQQYLNDNAQGYPATAVAMQAAVGYGTWSSGWLFNIASGNDTGAFGGVTMTAAGTPVYGIPGPRAGIDRAVGFDSLTDEFQAGDVFDVTATDDLCIAWVGMWTAHPSAVEMMVVKRNAAAIGYTLFINGVNGLRWDVHSASGGVVCSGDITALIGKWHVGMAVIDRSTNKSRVAIRALDGSATLLSPEGSLFAETSANADNFQVGNRTNLPASSWRCAALYVANGSGAASGMSANLSTALTNFANAVNAAWSVTLGSDGRVTIANSNLPSSVAFTNTTLRNLLGFDADFDYPTTAAQLSAALGGVGTWTSGSIWMCNETSGSLAPSLGSITLAPGSTPTYGHQGCRGGNDKAIGFDSGNDRFDGGTSAHNVTAIDDLIALWVAYVAATPSGSVDGIVSKLAAGAGWQVNLDTAGYIYFQGFAAGPSGLFSSSGTTTVSNHARQWHVGIAVIDRSTGRARVGTCPINGAPTISTEMVIAASSMANSDAFRIGERADNPGIAPTTTTIAYAACVTGPGVATGLSANLSAALSSFATYMRSQTGTKQARSIYYPDCPLFVAESDPRLAPVGSDARTAVSGTGDRITHVGVYHRYHRSLIYSHVPEDRVREQAAQYANASFRTFWDDTQLARGNISWFRAGSSLLITDHSGVVLGQDMQSGGPSEGWGVTDPRSVEPKRVDPGGWGGRWRIEIPELIAKDE